MPIYCHMGKSSVKSHQASFYELNFKKVSDGAWCLNHLWLAGYASAYWQIKASKDCGSCNQKHDGPKAFISGLLNKNINIRLLMCHYVLVLVANYCN